MKKRCILTILPALMVLAGCAGVNAQPKANIMLEDTEAHSEIFGGVESPIDLRVRREGEPAVDPLAQPKIGVQYKHDDSGYSIRFVAAITSLDIAKATWTRGVTTEKDENGGKVPLKPNASFETTKAYLSLTDGDDTSTASVEYPGYMYYIVYTMRNIPAAYKGDYMFAYLTIKGTNGTEVSSKVVASKIEENDNSFTFNADKSNFFLAGKINGLEGAAVSEDNPKRNNTDAATFTANLLVGDNFVVVQKTSTLFKVWDGSCLKSINNGFSVENEKVKVNQKAKYVLYLNTSNEIWHSQYGLTGTGYYVRGNAAGGWDSGYTAYEFFNDPDDKGVLLNVHLSVGEFKIGKASWDDYNLGSDRLMGGAKDSGDITTASNWESKSNMRVVHAGYYNLYLTSNDYISIETVSLDA